jgi:3-hydroxyisobutyrate dehydrogenase-like beta-hydroxyacid dehydrogenase
MSAPNQERVGVIGLGIIGSVWAQNYETDGVLAATWNRSQKPGAPRAVASAKAVAEAASVVQIAVADPPAVSSVLDAIEPALGKQHLVIQSSTIDPESSEAFARRVEARGASYVEAPFMGSRPAAEQRKTVFLLGGKSAVIERADPVLAHLSELRHRIGTERQAAALKLAFNLQVAIMMEGICESLATARRAGITDEAYFGVLRGTALWSGFHALKEPKLRDGEFSPQFSVKHMLKDVRLATGMGQAGALPVAETLKGRLEAGAQSGLEELDFAALIKLL